ncbi:MAG: carboxypeptidase regulatory-like domain-containing protein [Planctomycetota bacterium]
MGDRKGTLLLAVFVVALLGAGIALLVILGDFGAEEVVSVPDGKGEGEGGSSEEPVKGGGAGVEKGTAFEAGDGEGPKESGTGGKETGADVPLEISAGEVAGRIIDGRSKKPLPDATVTARPVGGEGRSSKVTTAGPTGAFLLKGLLTGAFELEVAAKGYRTARRKKLALGEGAGLHVGEIPLEPHPLILGTVKDSEGKPVASAALELTAETGLKIGPDSNIIEFIKGIAVAKKILGETRSRADGAFAFYPGEVKEGDYCLRASAQGFATGMAHGVCAKRGEEPGEVELILVKPVILRGKVVDSSGAPVEGASIVALWADERSAMQTARMNFDKYWATSNEEGEFLFSDLVERKSDSYMLVAKKEGLSTSMKQARSPTKKDIVIELTEGFTLEGRVVDAGSGEGIPGAKIMAMGRRETGLGQAEADGEGRFRIENLNPGKYEMIVSAKGFTPEEERFEGTSGQIVEKEIRLTGGIEIVGRVLDGESRKPVAGVTILTVSDGEGAMFGGGIVKTVSGPDGAFKLERAPVFDIGEWDNELKRKVEMEGVTLAAVKNGWVQREPQKIEVAQGQDKLTGIELAIHVAPRASGKIVDEKGAAVSGAEIIVVGSEEMDIELRMFLGMKPEKLFSDSEGNFTAVLGLGRYMFLIVSKKGYAHKQVKFESMVAGKEVTGMEIRLTRGGTIKGTVLDESGNPLAGEKVRCVPKIERRGEEEAFLYHPRMMDLLEEVRTGPRGEFTISHVRAGSWQLSLESDRGGNPDSQFVEVEDGRTSEVTLRKTPRLAIRGTVVDETGAPVSEAGVSARSMDPGRSGWGWDRTGRDGVFEVRNLKGGMYRLHVHAGGYTATMLEKIQAGASDIRIVLTKAKK